MSVFPKKVISVGNLSRIKTTSDTRIILFTFILFNIITTYFNYIIIKINGSRTIYSITYTAADAFTS
jgi:hypothetical protein